MIVPDLDVSATLTADGRSLRLAVINRHRTAPITARILLDSAAEHLPRRARVRDIGVGIDDVLASNTLDRPDRVALVDRGEAEVSADGYAFPPHSISLLSFALDTGR